MKPTLNMKKILALLFLSVQLFAQSDWKPVPGKPMTPWAEQVTAEKPLNDYPRPQLVRENWQNLNGLWDYAISPGKLNAKPSAFEGKILVPYPVESALSGVGRRVGKDSTLWYKTEVDVTVAKDKDILLHFGAVDWKMELYLNGTKVGDHEGGYDPFSFNITPYLNAKKGKKQEIIIGVWDPTNDGPQPNGKQVKNPHGIWYTPVTGIWQTVWLEAVPKTSIRSTKQTPDLDKKQLSISAEVSSAQAGDIVKIEAYDGSNKIAGIETSSGQTAALNIASPKLWSPDSPFLYDLKISVIRNGKILDEVKSYFAMRKISMKADEKGIQRMLLNDKFLFHYGPLDQGWWPDGLYTAPTDEALKFDVVKTKEMGFNMIRKHIKVEPARWYYHCDKLGMLVWQDMPSGDLGGNDWDMRLGNITGRKLEKDRSLESETIFKKEWKAIMDVLHNFPSIVVWVPFNEAWGQFKTKEITEWTQKYDASRLINSASGGNFYPTGDILDIHHYPEPQMPDPQYFGKNQVLVLGEFGGLGLPVDGHTWQVKDNWGYQSFKNKEDLKKRYSEFVQALKPLIKVGLSAAVYTQTTDVEVEINGLMTYDRKVIKIAESELKTLHSELYKIK
jgi:beta-galactosidase/beta-glucuronidase